MELIVFMNQNKSDQILMMLLLLSLLVLEAAAAVAMVSTVPRCKKILIMGHKVPLGDLAELWPRGLVRCTRPPTCFCDACDADVASPS